MMNILDEICEYFGTQGGVIRDYRQRLLDEIDNKEREYKKLQDAYNNDINSYFSYGMLKQARGELNYVKGLYTEAFTI